jgi:subtilisin-like proprotein convertase family protein/subtilisin family serine protease
VADDGFDLTHPDFPADKIVGRLNVRPDTNGVGLSFDEDVRPRPGNYHGTPCAGVALAEHNGTGTVGVAPGCGFYAVRFPLNLSDAQLARMFERISNQADVVSCSWGFGPANAPMSTTLRDTVTHLAAVGGRRGKGLVFCVAAGNNNCPVRDLGNTATYQYLDQFGSVRTYSGPIDRWIAAHPEVITVSASTSLKTRAAYSSWGAEINVCAPSNNFDDLQRFRPRGLGIWTTDNEGFGSRSDFTPGSRFTGDFGGTSSATPTVAGVCGLVISRNQSLTAKEVREIIEKTANKNLVIASETAVNLPGDFGSNGFSPWFGYGKVNAAAAVQMAANISGQLVRVDQMANDVPIEIPDVGAPINSRISIGDSGTIEELRIRVSITHTYISDLRIDLIAPDGVAATLHNHEGGSQRNLDRIYSSTDVPALRALIGKPLSGSWILRVVDQVALDKGHLNSWELSAKVSAA